MQIKSIILKNFRQFQNTKINFSTDEDKNVTFIMAKNGVGKTTLAQAFSWCLYGESDFTDQKLLNKKIAQDMPTNDVCDVVVELRIKHRDIDYSVSRKLSYRKEFNGEIKAEKTILYVAKKDLLTGEDKSINGDAKCQNEIQSILPKELYRYFFFDGERIEKMSLELTNHKKANDFKDSVHGLLGLAGINSAIDHLKPSSKISVISSYEKEYSSNGNSQMENAIKKCENCKAKIEEIEKEITECENQITKAQEDKKKNEDKLKTYEESAKFERAKERLEKEVNALENQNISLSKDIFRNFSDNVNSFFNLSLISKAFTILKDENFESSDIPRIHADSIKYLLLRNECVCGKKISEDLEIKKHLEELVSKLPPESIGNIVKDFRKKARENVNDSNKLLTRHSEKYEKFQLNIATINEKYDEIESIKKLIIEGSSITVSNAQRSINEDEKIIEQMNERIKELNIDLGSCKKDIENAENERKSLSNLCESNKKIEILRAYAYRIYKDFFNEYKKYEDKIRIELENKINEIFKEIFDGDFVLKILEDYHIEVSVKNYLGTVETSSAQSVSVIFAFITGIIDMARSKKDEILLAESYPLVMDAPLSSFDKARIQAVCQKIPTIAEQVIIFIKDTDGDLAKKFLGEKIGSEYLMTKIDELETKTELKME